MAGAKRRANIAGERPLREARARTPEEEADAALFREATRDVRPLGEKPLPPPQAKPPPPRARFTRADRLAVLEESLHGDPGGTDVTSGDGAGGGESASFARPGVQTSVLRKLRRGHYRIQAEIDLHGLTVQQAKSALREFLAEALDRGHSCVRIIHGKGLRSGPRGPVLRSAVSGVLQRTGRVLAFVSARAVDGGTGAVYVLLSSRPR